MRFRRNLSIIGVGEISSASKINDKLQFILRKDACLVGVSSDLLGRNVAKNVAPFVSYGRDCYFVAGGKFVRDGEELTYEQNIGG